jgi:hypothetical protein
MKSESMDGSNTFTAVSMNQDCAYLLSENDAAEKEGLITFYLCNPLSEVRRADTASELHHGQERFRTLCYEHLTFTTMNGHRSNGFYFIRSSRK